MLNPPNMTHETTVVLWSPSQKLFHIETMTDTLKSGRDIFADQTNNDYIVLACFDVRDEAYEFTDLLREKFLNKREFPDNVIDMFNRD